MNINMIKESIEKLKGERIIARVNIGRNKFEKFEGIILQTYPSLFTIKTLKETKSFSYADVLTQSIVIKKIN